MRTRSHFDTKSPPDYIVTAQNCRRLRRKMKEASTSPEVVTANWLRQSAAQGEEAGTTMIHMYSLPLVLPFPSL